MALYMLSSLGAPSFTGLRMPPRRISVGSSSSIVVSGGVPLGQCMASIKVSDQTITRRTANYHPPIWGFDYIQTLTSEYVGESYAKRVEKLKEDIREMLDEVVDPLHKLELIDDLQRLGVAYHFQDEIKKALNKIYSNNPNNSKKKQENLYAVALEFGLLRQHGYDISQEIFSSFRDEKGNLKLCFSGDCKGILYLYEAVYLLKAEEESFFDEARNFTTTYLKDYVKHNKDDEYLSTLVNRALELPLHYRIMRFESRWFIDVYERRKDANPVLLDLAKIDFNIVQAIHQQDLKSSSSWWRNTGLGEKLSFARDRLMECFLWNVGTLFQPQFEYCRILVTKLNALITTIDDVYDVYGTLDELQLFTDAVERWDVNAMEQLPPYMRLCFLALHNSINEIAFDALKEQGIHIIPYLKKEWANLCNSYLVEAKWYNSGYVPCLGEYIDNAVTSVGVPLILIHVYFFITKPTRTEAFECLQEYNNIFRCASMIVRYADDLGTSTDELKRGDVPKSIQCYMHETGASEEDAREYIRELITCTWMKINEERAEKPHLSDTILGYAMNLARMAQCMYQYGDGHGVEDRETKDHVLSMLVNPFQIMYRDHT